MTEYTEDDRRKSGADHDLLIEIHSMVKGLQGTFTKHEDSDEKNFSRLYSMHGTLKWYVGIGLGIVLAVQAFLFKLLK